MLHRLMSGSVFAHAYRIGSGAVLNKLAELMPNFVGGSADLAPSNKTGAFAGDGAHVRRRGFSAVGGTEDLQIGNPAHPRQLLDGLMRGTVF